MNGLGGALISLVRDLDPALMRLISVACYLLGLLAFRPGVRAPAAALGGPLPRPLRRRHRALLPGLPGHGVLPLLALRPGARACSARNTAASASLGHGSAAADYDALLGAVLTVVGWVGLLAFLRGVFVLRAAADGQPGASAGRAAMHMLGGVCAWHAESLIGAVQTSLGIQVLRIT